MSRRYTKSRNRVVLAVVLLVLILVTGVVGAQLLEERMAVPIEDAGKQLTAHTTSMNAAQVFMNDRWYAQRNVDTLLVMGIDDYGSLTESDSYMNNHQTDFLVLFIRDLDSGRTTAVHLNRDTMTDITTLGVTGEATGSVYAQLALAYNYGSGDQSSSMNTVDAVEHLLYGMPVDHYITVTMDAVPIINDWAGGVVVEVQDDFAGVDETLVQGQLTTLKGQQALTYVRSRKTLEDSSNLHRMERQRQYASAWVKVAQHKLRDVEAVADLMVQLDGFYRSNCTVEKLQEYAQILGENHSLSTYETKGKAVKGDVFMEFYVDEEALQQLVLDLFYVPVL